MEGASAADAESLFMGFDTCSGKFEPSLSPPVTFLFFRCSYCRCCLYLVAVKCCYMCKSFMGLFYRRL